MAGTPDFNELEVRVLLTGSKADIDRALTLIQRHLSQRLVGWLNREFPKIQAADLNDIWEDTLLGVLKAAQERRFDSSRALLPWLYKIARARAIDRGRRADALERALTALARTLENTQTGRLLEKLTPEERNELWDLFQKATEWLPGQQQLVLRVYIDHFPETQSMAYLQQEVSHRSGRPETVAGIKRALQEARAKARKFLSRKGYDVRKRGQP